MDMDRIKQLEARVHRIWEKRDWGDPPKSIDGYTLEFFKLKAKHDRLQRMVDRGFELNDEQWNDLRNFKKMRKTRG